MANNPNERQGNVDDYTECTDDWPTAGKRWPVPPSGLRDLEGTVMPLTRTEKVSCWSFIDMVIWVYVVAAIVEVL